MVHHAVAQDRVDDERTVDASAENDMHQSTDSSDAPLFVEGILHCRRGRSSSQSSLLWKRRFVSLSLSDGGSITVYKKRSLQKDQRLQTTALHTVYTKVHQTLSNSSRGLCPPTATLPDAGKGASWPGNIIDIHLPPHVPWVVKDVENDTSNFVVEVDTSSEETEGSTALLTTPVALEHQESTISSAVLYDSLFCSDDNSDIPEECDDEDEDEHDVAAHEEKKTDLESSVRATDDPVDHNELLESISFARSKGKAFRVYFRCNKGRNEKALWLQAFSRLNRLSTQVRRRKTLLGSLTTSFLVANSRRRLSNSLARDVRHLELRDDELEAPSESVVQLLDHYNSSKNVEELARGKDSSVHKDKEYRVQPTYAYPHRWMTRGEMREEMVLPSEVFHDLRHAGCIKKEVGYLKVEVLQCLGLPKLDRTSLTDAIVYLVCGEYAFATDVIPNRANPMWLRKSRRACVFPVFHAYARLYVGVFDDDRKRVKDEFAGRVVIDLARLRPKSTYDVTLPLRLSAHVYSRRRRGAIRLRFSVTWKTERDALLSYIPRKVHIPLPQNSKPRLDVAVLCADQKAFRNIAITVHGANLPGKFTFQQMRAAIREINYTRKYIFTAIRTWVRETRHWQHPTTSALIFLAWMHCIYANQFSLVPAYIVMFFVFQLMRTYAKFGVDAPCQQGFIPPSWEELMSALLRGGDEGCCSIEPLSLGIRPLPLVRRKSPQSLVDACETTQTQFDYTVKTHQPKGKNLFRALGLMDDWEVSNASAANESLEFPFANRADYPRFTVKESLVPRRGEGPASTKELGTENRSSDENEASFFVSGGDELRLPRLSLDMVEMPEILRHMELPDIQAMMRKDSSGLREFDEEEENFAARHAVVHTGKVAASTITRTGRVAASTISKTATGLTDIASGLSEKSGLHHVVSPISSTIQRGSNTIQKGISSGISSSVHFVQGPVSQVLGPVGTYSNSLFRTHSMDSDHSITRSRSVTGDSSALSNEVGFDEILSSNLGSSEDEADVDPLLVFPEQNVDVEGPSSGKKITEDLAEIKEKMHEMTWNLFNDKIYHIKHRDSCYFGQSKKGKRRKADVAKDLDKLLKVNQFSHPNPFVARVGLYVEPIIGSAYSFLLPFRAGFNVMTWRDPMLTFWVSVFCGVLGVILFVFPWRVFLFFLGFFLVGPQNWAIRILRETGHLPPLPPRRLTKKKDDEVSEDSVLPTDQPVFTLAHRQPGGEIPEQPSEDLDPREIHRVVVPYSPLMYQRFYDWPPEPQYAQVIPDFPDDALRRKPNSNLSSAHAAARTPISFFLRSGSVSNLSDPDSNRSLRRRLNHHRPRVLSSGNLLKPRSLRPRSRSVGDAPTASSNKDV